MRLISLFVLTILLPILVKAQDFPTPIIGHAFCKPGVENASPGKGLSIQYIRHPNYELTSGFKLEDNRRRSDVERKERLDAKLKIPLLNKDEWKALIGLYHSFEKYTFDYIAPPNNYYFNAIDDQMLKRTRATAFLFKALDSRNYLALRLGASFNGNYEGLVQFDNRYAVYRAALVWGFKKTNDKELGIGLLMNKSFRRTAVYPFLIYNRTFNEKWGIESVLPVKISLRRNLNEESLLLASAEYWSSAYSMDIVPNEASRVVDFHFKSSAMHFYVDWQNRLLSNWTWTSLKLGYAWNFDSRFINTETDQNFNAFPSHSIFVSVGFFLSPPKNFRK